MEIIPAIMPKDMNEIRDKVVQVKGIVSFVQLDLMDGRFVEAKTWPFFPKDKIGVEEIIKEESGMPYWEDINYEFDLMVEDAGRDIEKYVALGASRLIFHFEAESKLKENLEKMESYIRNMVQIGLAFDIATDVSEVLPLIPLVDFVQCMGIDKDGVQGEPFDEKALEHVRAVRKAYPDMPISVDGGVNLSNAKSLIEAGATRLVSGSTIWRSFDAEETIKEFQSLV